MQTHRQLILDQKPCVVCHLDGFDRFLVGTYELFPTLESARLKFGPSSDNVSLQNDLDKINQRAGKLILIDCGNVSCDKWLQEPKIDYQYDCTQGGGVFDAKISADPSGSSATIYVAHSNGSIGIYELAQIEGAFKITQKNHIKVSHPSNLLTSIDLVLPNPSHISAPCTTESESPRPKLLDIKIFVGDSKGTLSVVDNRGLIQETLGEDESIWQVKSLKLNEDNCVIIVGAENCSWYIYSLNEATRKVTQIYKNQYRDFQAGVTSIFSLGCSHQQDHSIFEILLGSYDESLQAYQIRIEHEDNLTIKKPSIRHKGKRSIGGGGIWRIKSESRSGHHNGDDRLFIAAMYAGTFALELSDGSDTIPILSDANNLSELLEIGELGSPNPPLHYDIDISFKCSAHQPLACIADFNNSLCLLTPIRRVESESLPRASQVND